MKKIQLDIPILNSDEDFLNRNNYAKNVAEILYNFHDTKSLIVALNGAWGSGKTSFINLIKEVLKTKSDYIKTNDSKICYWIKKIINYLFIFACLVFVWRFSFIKLFADFNLSPMLKNYFNISPLNIYRIFVFTEIALKLIITLSVFVSNIINLNWLFHLITAVYNKINLSEKKGFYIIDFAPWNTVSESSILKDFFDTLRKSIKNVQKQEIITKLDNYIVYLCSKMSSKVLNFQTDDDLTLVTIKNDLIKALSNTKQKFFVFIDDIDRLNDSEINLIFKIVKSFADLPNIIYFLSFDKSIVTNALNNSQEKRGNEFLEKIVQIEIDVPEMQENDIKKYLYEVLETNLEQSNNNGEDWESKYKTYWGLAYATSFHKFFTSIRDVKRFANALNISFTPQIYQEVNIVDFWLITVIKLFVPDLYNFIKNNKNFLTYNYKQNFNILLSEKEKKEYSDNLKNILTNIKKPIKTDIHLFLSAMFPNLDYIDIQGFSLNPYTEKEKITTGRICCEKHFDKYFTFDLNREKWTSSFMKKSITFTNEEFKNLLLELDDHSELKDFLSKLEYYINEHIPTENAENIIRTLFDYGDYFKIYEGGFLETDIYVQMERIIYQLLKNKEAESDNIIKNSFSANKSIIPAISFTELVDHMIMKNDTHKYITQENLNYFISKTNESIKLWADNDINNVIDETKPYRGQLLEHQKTSNILYFWYNYGNKSELNEYINKITTTDLNLLKFIGKLVSVTKSYISYNMDCSETEKIYSYNLERYFNDLDALKGRLLSIDKSNLDENNIKILNLAIMGIEQKDNPKYNDL